MMGASEAVMLLVLLGGMGLPLGMPPEAEDPVLAAVAPEDCTFYLTWSGMAKPNPTSNNQTEQLLAEPEMQRFFQQLDEAITAMLRREGGGPGADETRKVMIAEVPKVVRAILTRPTAIFAGKLSIGARGPQVDGGIVVNTGDRTDVVRAALERIEKTAAGGSELPTVRINGAPWHQLPMPPDAPPVLWGFQGKYLIIGVGEGSIESILKRQDGKPPKWLVDVREKQPVGRRASFGYLNVDRLRALAVAALGQSPFARTATDVIDATGLSNLSYIASATGLDETGCVTRVFASFEGKPRGLFALVGQQPLTTNDLSVIPADSTLALAFRADTAQIFSGMLDIAEKIEPSTRKEANRTMDEINRMVGLDIEEDILKALGDTWRVYNSPSQGGLVFSGLTAVVSVRDSAQLEKSAARIEKFVQRMNDDFIEGNRDRILRTPRHATIDHFEHGGQKVYFVKLVGEFSPVAPAWCVTKDAFVISLYPSHVKAYLDGALSRERTAAPTPSGERSAAQPPRRASRAVAGNTVRSFADVPQIAKLFASDEKGGPPATPPTFIAYQDTRALFDLAYPFVQLGATFLTSEAQREGFPIDMSMFPSAPSISRHLRPGVTTIEHTASGIELVSRQSTPINMSALPLIVPTVFFFGVRSAELHRIEPPAIEEAKPADEVPRAEPEEPRIVPEDPAAEAPKAEPAPERPKVERRPASKRAPSAFDRGKRSGRTVGA